MNPYQAALARSQILAAAASPYQGEVSFITAGVTGPVLACPHCVTGKADQQLEGGGWLRISTLSFTVLKTDLPAKPDPLRTLVFHQSKNWKIETSGGEDAHAAWWKFDCTLLP